MDSYQKEWQKTWHKELGTNPNLILSEIDCDYSLHFDIWGCDQSQLKKLFSELPQGDKIFRRIECFSQRKVHNTTKSDGEYHDLLTSINQNVKTVLREYGDSRLSKINSELEECRTLNIYRGNSELKAELFSCADEPTVTISDDLGLIIEKKLGKKAKSAYYFLIEPLYRLGNNSYHVVHWIIWAMLDDFFSVDPYAGVIELYFNSATAGFNGDEHFVYVEKTSNKAIKRN